MKHIYTLFLGLLSVTAFAQQPAWLGTNVGDGIIYSEYQLFDHGVVSSYRVMAQNSVMDTSLEWNFITAAADYSINWRPYTSGEVYSAYNMIIDPSVETASARYNAGSGGQPCVLAEVQAGNYYTFIVENNETADNRMNIVETTFDPVMIDTVYHSPNPVTETDIVTITVELDGSLMPSIGEHVFIRYTFDGWQTSDFGEVTNFSNGVGTWTAGGTVPADTTVEYYALSTTQSAPDDATIDFWTLFFANNANLNYSYVVQTVTGMEENELDVAVWVAQDRLRISGIDKTTAILLLDMNGKVVLQESVSGNSSIPVSHLPSGTYICNIDGRLNRRFVIN